MKPPGVGSAGFSSGAPGIPHRKPYSLSTERNSERNSGADGMGIVDGSAGRGEIHGNGKREEVGLVGEQDRERHEIGKTFRYAAMPNQKSAADHAAKGKMEGDAESGAGPGTTSDPIGKDGSPTAAWSGKTSSGTSEYACKSTSEICDSDMRFATERKSSGETGPSGSRASFRIADTKRPEGLETAFETFGSSCGNLADSESGIPWRNPSIRRTDCSSVTQDREGWSDRTSAKISATDSRIGRPQDHPSAKTRGREFRKLGSPTSGHGKTAESGSSGNRVAASDPGMAKIAATDTAVRAASAKALFSSPRERKAESMETKVPNQEIPTLSAVHPAAKGAQDVTAAASDHATSTAPTANLTEADLRHISTMPGRTAEQKSFGYFFREFRMGLESWDTPGNRTATEKEKYGKIEEKSLTHRIPYPVRIRLISLRLTVKFGENTNKITKMLSRGKKWAL